MKDSLSFENDVKRFSAGLKFGLPYMAVIGAQYTRHFLTITLLPTLTTLDIRMRILTGKPSFVFLNGVYHTL